MRKYFNLSNNPEGKGVQKEHFYIDGTLELQKATKCYTPRMNKNHATESATVIALPETLELPLNFVGEIGIANALLQNYKRYKGNEND